MVAPASKLGGGEPVPSLERKLAAVGGRCGVPVVAVLVIVDGWPLPVDEGSPCVLVARTEPVPEPPLPGVLDFT